MNAVGRNLADAEFDESKRVRDEAGRFASKNGSSFDTGVESDDSYRVEFEKLKEAGLVKPKTDYRSWRSKLERERAQASEREEERKKEKELAVKRAKNVNTSAFASNFTQEEKESISQYYLSGDSRGAQAEGREAAVSAIERALREKGVKIEHVSISNDGKGRSVYAKVGGEVVRISDHELPMTAKRENDRARGLTGKWNREVVVIDWQTTPISEYMAEIFDNQKTDENTDFDKKWCVENRSVKADSTAQPDKSRPQAAGTLIVADGKMLFIRRGQRNDHPGEWAMPGGMVEAGESLEDAARRETSEETGFTPGEMRELATWRDGDVDFTIFFTETEPFDVVLSTESDGAKWMPLGQAPEPLMESDRQFLESPPFLAVRKSYMTETDVARAIMNGEMASPQEFQKMWLFALRITGTGAAWRSKDGEFVYRDPAIFLNDEFLERCNGLPVILEHPEERLLDSDYPEEFRERVVGATFMPFVATVKSGDDGSVRAIADERGDEVWAIARIYSKAAAHLLMERQLSTSPGVMIPKKNGTVVLDNGATLLVEGNPLLLDHIAICDKGVWDKGGEPSGVSVTNEEGKIMADENVVNKDGTEPTNADVSDKADAKKKADAELEEAKAKADADAENYASLKTMCDALQARVDELEKGKGEEKKADDADPDAEAKAKEAEAARLKAEAKAIEATQAGAKSDDDDDKKKLEESIQKADSLKKENNELVKRIRQLEEGFLKMASITPKPLTDEDYAQIAHAQARADSVYSAFGKQAPRALNGEDLLAYRKRLAAGVKKHSRTWKDVDFSRFDSAAFDVTESQIYADAMEEARHPTDLGDGELREVTKQTRAGQTITEFFGSSPSAWMDSFCTPRLKSRLISRPAMQT